ncbi:MAG TPA: DNA-3-methyladenine glycosylase I, partial [Planctomycetaceae bacterium]|nr:DNA-3-methyladenine glycosylase I [Planctomycetaceae bacterium]
QFQMPLPQPLQGTSAATKVSRRLSDELKRRDWKFVGPTTCYSFMQAVGLVNDHLPTCFVRGKLDQLHRH